MSKLRFICPEHGCKCFIWCDQCRIEAIKKLDKIEAQQEKEHSKYLRENLNELTYDAGVPVKLVDVSFDFYRERKLTKLSDKVKSMFGKSVFLWGNPGTGKSCAAVLLLKKAILDDMYTAFFPAAEIVRMIRRDWRTSNDGMVSSELKHVDLLAIDDLLAPKADTKDAFDLIYDIVDDRYRNKKTTVITCNKDLNHIAQKYDARFSSRMQDYMIHQFTGEDLRGK